MSAGKEAINADMSVIAESSSDLGAKADNSVVDPYLNVVFFHTVNNTMNNLEDKFLPSSNVKPSAVPDVEHSEVDNNVRRVEQSLAQLRNAIERPQSSGSTALDSNMPVTTSSSTAKPTSPEPNNPDAVSGSTPNSVTSTTLRAPKPAFQMMPVFKHLLDRYFIPPLNSSDDMDDRFHRLADAMATTVFRKGQMTLCQRIKRLYDEENFDLRKAITTSNTGNMRECLPVLKIVLEDLQAVQSSAFNPNWTIDEKVLFAARILGVYDECNRTISTRDRIQLVWKEMCFPLQGIPPSNNRIFVQDGKVMELSSAVQAIKRELELDDSLNSIGGILLAASKTITLSQEVFLGPNDQAKAIARELGILDEEIVQSQYLV